MIFPVRLTRGPRSQVLPVRHPVSGWGLSSRRSRSGILACSLSRSHKSTRCPAAASSLVWARAGWSTSIWPMASLSGEAIRPAGGAARIVTGLWATPDGETYSFRGEHYELTDAPALPKPVQQRIPVVVGGRGRRRTPEL